MGLEAGSRVPQEAVDNGRRLIGLPNFGRMDGLPLSHAEDVIRDTFSGRKNVLILPYAAFDMDKQEGNAKKALSRIVPDLGIRSLHTISDAEIPHVLGQADGLVMPGGDTYVLAAALQKQFVLDAKNGERISMADLVRRQVAREVITAGTSAGFLIMARSIDGAEDTTVPAKTVGGELVVGVDGLRLLPDDVHPAVHYIDHDEEFSEDDQETMFAAFPKLRKLFDHLHSMPANIQWYLRYNPRDTVLAMRDDSYVFVHGTERMEVGGENGGIIFEAGKSKQIVEPGANLSHLLLPRSA